MRLFFHTPLPVLYLSFFAGLALLILGADLMVRGASRLSLSFGISPLVIGLTVVAFGTSAPELAVSVRGAFTGQADIALGNVVGSNIFNVLCILGLSALVAPLIVDRQVVRQEVPIMIGLSLLLWLLALDGHISRGNGLLLIALLAAYNGFLFWQVRRRSRRQVSVELELPEDSCWDRHWAVQVGLVVFGLILLVLGARWLVESAVAFAAALGVSELVIGLTIVSAGTSLPEIATSVVAAARGQRDIAVGNVVGSNIFNIVGVLGVTASVAPAALPVAPALLAFDLQVMVAAAIACLPILFTGHRIARWEGALFLGYYFAYTVYLILYAQDHDALDEYTLVMTTTVIPLTVLTIAIVSWREWRGHRALARRGGR